MVWLVELTNFVITELGLAKLPEVMKPIARSEAVEPQLYLPPVAGEPEDAAWLTVVKFPEDEKFAVEPAPAAVIFQLEGKLAAVLVPILSKFSETELFNAVMAICPQLKFPKMTKKRINKLFCIMHR